jgi:hypothetical protein
MNPLLQNYLLASVLPSVVVPLLIALVAILGVARWRRTLLVLALVELIFLVLGAVALRTFTFGAVSTLPVRVLEFLQEVGTPLIVMSVSIATVGLFLALTLAARARRWGWFVALLLAAIISVLAAGFSFSPVPLIALFGYDTAQALRALSEPLYIIVSNGLAALTMLVQLLYAIFGPRDAQETQETGAPATAPASASDVTLP